MKQFNGWLDAQMSQEQLSNFYEKQIIDGQEMFYENEYLIIRNDQNEVVDYAKKLNGKIVKVPFNTLGDKNFEILKPRNPQQYCAFDMLRDERTTVKLVTGTWGSGKSIALIAAALEKMATGKYDRIVWIRNNVEAKDTVALGALPGSKDEKLDWCLGPFVDHCSVEYTTQLKEQGKLVVEHIGHLRGRDLKHSILICTEAENLTKSQIQLIIARCGEGSVVMFDADTQQRDRAVFEKSRGVETMIDRFKNHPLFGYIHLVKSERSETADMANLLND